MAINNFIMPTDSEIENLKKKYGIINLVEIKQGDAVYKAITRQISKNVVKGLDYGSDAVFRAVWDRIKLIYDPEFDTNDILIIEAINILTKK